MAVRQRSAFNGQLPLRAGGVARRHGLTTRCSLRWRIYKMTQQQQQQQQPSININLLLGVGRMLHVTSSSGRRRRSIILLNTLFDGTNPRKRAATAGARARAEDRPSSNTSRRTRALDRASPSVAVGQIIGEARGHPTWTSRTAAANWLASWLLGVSSGRATAIKASKRAAGLLSLYYAARPAGRPAVRSFGRPAKQ